MTSIKIGAVVALMGGCFAAGWYANRQDPIIETKVETVEKVVTKVVKETVTAPDGTKSEKTTTETSENKKTKDKIPQPLPATTAYRPVYSLALDFNPIAGGGDERFIPVGTQFGYRVIGNAWVTAGYNWQTKAATVGLRYDF